MEDLGIKLHPVKKIQLWDAIKKSVFQKMDNNIITPERADEILAHVKSRLSEITSPEQAKQFYLSLPQIYSELSTVVHKFELEEAEAIDTVLTLFLDVMIEKGDFDLASQLTGEIRASGDHEVLAKEMQRRYPVEFDKSIERLLHAHKRTAP